MPPKKKAKTTSDDEGIVSREEFERLLGNSLSFDRIKEVLEEKDKIIEEQEERIECLEAAVEELQRLEELRQKDKSSSSPSSAKSCSSSSRIAGTRKSKDHPNINTGKRWHKKCAGSNCRNNNARLYCISCDEKEIVKEAIALYCYQCMLGHVKKKECLERCGSCGEKSEVVKVSENKLLCGGCVLQEGNEKGNEGEGER